MSTSSKAFCDYLPSKKGRRKRRGGKSNTRKSPKDFGANPSRSFVVAPAPKTFQRVRTSSRRKDAAATHISSGEDGEDYNILHIDAKIQKKLRLRISSLPEFQKDLDRLTWIIENGETNIDRAKAQARSDIIRRRIKDLETTFELGYYLLISADLLDEYRNLQHKTRERNFVANVNTCNIKDISRKGDIILQYMCIARRFIDIPHFCQQARKMKCSNDECEATDFNFDGDCGYTCLQCGTQVVVMDESHTFRDTERINMSNRYKYSIKGHFIDAMKKFQAKQNTTIDNSVYDILEKQAHIHNLSTVPSAAERFLQKSHIYMFLSENGLSKHYDDINLIHKNMTGVSAPNVSYLEQEVLEDYDEMEKAYPKVKDPERINSLNVYFKLAMLLSRRGYRCKPDDFFILRTETKLDEHMEKWYELCDVLGWEKESLPF